MTDLIDEILRMAEDLLKDLPPPTRAIVARHDVPYGRAFRYWNTRGQLLIYANRGEIEDMPHRAPAPAAADGLGEIDISPVVGIPIWLEP